jgi:antitoxin component YwqK of YwqJK toxin-antitoxin module
VETVGRGGFENRVISVAIAVLAHFHLFPVTAQAGATSPAAAAAIEEGQFACEADATLATGRPDSGLFAIEASKDVRAFWCERYDSNGIATRSGPYWETYANGRTRTQANYVDSRLIGPVSILNEDGSLFLSGFLEGGEWSGPLEIFHENGAVWLEARFDSGHLEGGLRTRYPDGALESETRYQAGREDGLARSFYPTAAGGRLKSEAHVEADRLVGRHRLLDSRGRLIRSIDWEIGPAAWENFPASSTEAASRGILAPQRTAKDRKRNLRD